MGLIHAIIGFFTFWLNINVKYKRIKDNDQKRDVSISLGVRSIIQTVICAALTVLFLWGAVALYFAFAGEAGLLFIFIIIGIIACAGCALASLVQGVIGGLLYMFYQFKLNKRPIRWVALAVWIAAVVGMIVAIALFIIPSI